MTADADIDAGWVARVRGALLLSACADATVRPNAARHLLTESGQAPASLPWLGASARSRSMVVLAEHLSRHGGRVDQAGLGRALIRDASGGRAGGDPWPGTSRTWVPSSRSWTGTTSMASQGIPHRSGVVNTMPVGLVPRVGLAVLARRARRAAAVSQAHPVALDVAAVEAVAVAFVARSAVAEPIDPEALVGQITSQVAVSVLHSALRLVPALARWGASEQQLLLQLGRYPRPAAGVSVGLAAFLIHPEDPWAAIRLALRVGGDAAAAAATTGALAGARHGDSTLPPSLEVPARLARAADSLARLNQPA